MTYLLDTCIISRLRKIKPDENPSLRKWILSHPESDYYISVLTLGEIQAGISKLKKEEREKKMVLEDWLLGELIPRFRDRTLRIDEHTVSIWGTMKGEMQAKGILLPVIDSLIAATATQHNLIIATENIKDFQSTDAKLINPADLSIPQEDAYKG